MALEKGYLLYGRYRIESVLGRGGMGSVYQALDENLGIQVAVKENLFTTEEYARQFRREATILAGLRHSNLPRVTDHFVIAGQGQYLVMDFIDGEDLRTRIDRGNLPNERLTIDFARQICDALHYLHNRQPPVVHRDIKPGNIRVTPDGRAVLVDFGLARLMEGPTTTTGAKAMTPGYSPPEQYGASRTDARTDIYALAATLYTLLTGSMPEDGLERALGQRSLTPIRTRNPKVSAGVASAIEKALEVLPENRYQVIGDFQKALTLALPPAVQTATVSAPVKKPEAVAAVAAPASKKPASPPKKPVASPAQKKGRQLGCTLVIVFLALLVAAGGLLFALLGPANIVAALQSFSKSTPTVSADRQTETALLPDVTATPMETETVTTGGGTDTPNPTAAPTVAATAVGKASRIAFVSDRMGAPQIFSMDLDGKNILQLTTETEGACQPDWSPDGLLLLFTSPCKSIDGPYIKTSIFRINADGSGRTSLTKVPGGDYDPAWSPDGKSIAVTSLQDGQNRQHIYMMDSNGDNRRLLSIPGGRDYQPRWSPDGKHLVFISAGSGLPIVFLENADPANLLQTEFSTIKSATTSSPDWSADNYILFVFNGQVVLYQEDSRFNKIELSLAYQSTTIARFSPDGKWVLFDMTVPIGGNRDIYLLPIVGATTATRITSDRSIETDPAWRPLPAA
jgi:serine/threonine protein kinase/Tol biopolymer transport system component